MDNDLRRIANVLWHCTTRLSQVVHQWPKNMNGRYESLQALALIRTSIEHIDPTGEVFQPQGDLFGISLRPEPSGEWTVEVLFGMEVLYHEQGWVRESLLSAANDAITDYRASGGPTQGPLSRGLHPYPLGDADPSIGGGSDAA